MRNPPSHPCNIPNGTLSLWCIFFFSVLCPEIWYFNRVILPYELHPAIKSKVMKTTNMFVHSHPVLLPSATPRASSQKRKLAQNKEEPVGIAPYPVMCLVAPRFRNHQNIGTLRSSYRLVSQHYTILALRPQNAPKAKKKLLVSCLFHENIDTL